MMSSQVSDLFSSYPVKTGCVFQKIHYLSPKYIDLDCVFISNTGDDREQGIPQRRSVGPGNSVQQPQSRFQTKTTSRHDFIFGIPYQ